MSLFGQQPSSSGSLFGQQSNQSGPPKLSLFGSTPNSQPQQSGNLFGSATASSQPQSGGLFGSTNQNTQSQQSGGLFGAAGAASGQSGGGLFGTASSQPASGGLFGSTANTSQPASGGLFGSTTTTQPASGGLFGSTTNTTQQQSGGLFGTANQTQQQSGGLFGASTNTSQPTGGSLFGATQQAQGSSLFPKMGQNQSTAQAPSTTQGTLNPPPSLFNQSLQSQPNRPSLSLFANAAPPQNSTAGRLPTLSLGQGAQPPAQPVSSGAKIDIAHLRGTTRFQDLTDDLQRELTEMENYIQAEISFHEQVEAMLPSHGQSITELPGQLDFLQNRLDAVESSMDTSSVSTKELKDVNSRDADDCRRVFRTVENLKLPVQFHYHGYWPNTAAGGAHSSSAVQRLSGEEEGDMDLVGFFRSQADEMRSTLGLYGKTVGEIEQHLRNVEVAVTQMGGTLAFKRGRGKEEQVRELAAVLREFEGAILGMAGRVGQARENVQEVILKGR